MHDTKEHPVTAQEHRVRLAIALALSLGSIVLTGGAATAISYRAAYNVSGTWLPANAEHPLSTTRRHDHNHAPCLEVHSACRLGETLPHRTTAGGRISYR
jgi:hypothetical protein